eukprot:Gregarina_sp_Poly_1__5092@NODE_269_length_10312_cov_190_473011_g234_i0_p4_GENE_NODE_269_length_10312_cov_190_473011_g234_i0NODE_269_length_10312_cov_190_473011_g234_i0_p4_ORF_typecomplete_len327_score43_18Proteasom_PSMB/PF10508_9/1_4e15_NODE_269_length_10312_cov_190_473011_g234_i083269306
MGLTISTLYQTDDILLKLTAGELILGELLKSDAGLEYVWNRQFYKACLNDLADKNVEPALLISLIRLISNIIERVPPSRPALLKNAAYLKSVQNMLATPPSDPDYVTKKSVGLSAMGCIGSKLNVEGLKTLNERIPQWITKLEFSLRSGTESELMAAMMATARILGGIESDGEHIPHPNDPLIQQTLTAFASSLCPRIVESVANRPFPAPREVGFRLLTGFLLRGIKAPIEEFCAKIELQTLLFSPPYADPAVVKYAKHEFVRAAVSLYECWIQTNCANRDFIKALKAYATHDAFFIPEEYKGNGQFSAVLKGAAGSQVTVAEKFA